MMHNFSVSAVLVGALAASACSDKGTDPSPNNSCRSYLATGSSVLTSSGTQTTTTINCGFSQATNQLTCTTTQGGSVCNVQTATYASKADFVDEIRVLPPVALLTSDAYTQNSACGTPARTNLYTYDAQKRLTKITDQASGFANTYTAWDASGRPTAATNPGPPATNYTWTYNDATRTQVQTVTTSSSITATTVWNTNGTIQSINTSAPTLQFSTVYTNNTTAEVCK